LQEDPDVALAAMEHLKYDDFDDALSLYEDILQSYDSFFQQVSPKQRDIDFQGFKLFIGVALHNIGVIHLLRGKYHEAFTYFERATLNRASSIGAGHSDHIVSLLQLLFAFILFGRDAFADLFACCLIIVQSSLVNMSICRYALEDFPSAHAGFEEALGLARGNKNTLADYRQLAGILNNLGCLAHMCGQTERAMELLEESLDAQNYAADKSLYAGSRFSCHTAALTLTITKANMGLIALLNQDVSLSIAAFEAAIKDQQLLLRDAHVTLISTMDHLVLAKIMAGDREKAMQVRLLLNYCPQMLSLL